MMTHIILVGHSLRIQDRVITPVLSQAQTAFYTCCMYGTSYYSLPLHCFDNPDVLWVQWTYRVTQCCTFSRRHSENCEEIPSQGASTTNATPYAHTRKAMGRAVVHTRGTLRMHS